MGQHTYRFRLVPWGIAIVGAMALSSLSAIALADPMPAATPKTSVSTLSNRQAAEQFVDALFSNNFKQAWTYLSPVLQGQITPQQLQQRQQFFLKRVRAFNNRLGTKLDGNIASVNIAFSNVTDTLILIFDDSGKITGVDFPANPESLSIQSPR